MTNPFRGAIAAALAATVPLIVLAQSATPSPASGRSASSPSSAAKSVAPAVGVTYKSSFEGYRRFDDQKVLPWRDANDNVGRIGGWQAYARESAGEESGAAPSGDHSQHKPAGVQASPQVPAARTPDSSPAPAKPATKPASTPQDAHDAHKGHSGNSMPKKP